MKGFIDIKRPSTTRIGSVTMKMRPIVRYLGVYLGTRMNITPNINYITEKSRNLFASLAKLAKEKWRLSTNILRILYTGLVLQIICYAAAGCTEKLNSHHYRKLRSTQRQALLAITRAYRTTSNDALTVLAAEIPIKLKIRERIELYHLRKNTEEKVGGIYFSPPPAPLDNKQKKIMKDRIRAEIIDIWQTEGDGTQKEKSEQRTNSSATSEGEWKIKT